tara:strand:- start:4 stop:261 length:258 start_codon:yes stop_codon:yes gene_type:complete
MDFNMKTKRKRRSKKRAEKEMKQKVGMFEKLPDACDACKKDFDKKNKEMVMSWNVVVREAQGVVRLYCPECWDAAIKAVQEVENG